jgi:hypothetical protein
VTDIGHIAGVRDGEDPALERYGIGEDTEGSLTHPHRQSAAMYIDERCVYAIAGRAGHQADHFHVLTSASTITGHSPFMERQEIGQPSCR